MEGKRPGRSALKAATINHIAFLLPFLFVITLVGLSRSRNGDSSIEVRTHSPALLRNDFRHKADFIDNASFYDIITLINLFSFAFSFFPVTTFSGGIKFSDLTDDESE